MHILIVLQTQDGLEKIPLELGTPSTVGQALEAAGVRVAEAESVSVWTQKCSLDDPLKNGDRIEICLPLIVDPKEARRLRAQIKTEGMLRRRKHAKG